MKNFYFLSLLLFSFSAFAQSNCDLILVSDERIEADVQLDLENKGYKVRIGEFRDCRQIRSQKDNCVRITAAYNKFQAQANHDGSFFARLYWEELAPAFATFGKKGVMTSFYRVNGLENFQMVYIKWAYPSEYSMKGFATNILSEIPTCQ